MSKWPGIFVSGFEGLYSVALRNLGLGPGSQFQGRFGIPFGEGLFWGSLGTSFGNPLWIL